MARASVVIPAGNLDEWLGEAVRSALASDFTDIEVIVVLNGAGDFQEPAWAGDPRVRLLSFPERLGPVGATLAGLAVATGDYYVHLDADDLMAPSRISLQVHYLDEHPDTVVAGCRTAFINEDGVRGGAFRLPTGHDVRAELVGLNVVPHSSMTTRLADLQAVGGYDPSLYQMEDYDLLLRLALVGTVAVLDQELSSYRLHSSQISRAVLPRASYVRTILEARKKLARHLGMSGAQLGIKNARWMFEQYAQYAYRSAVNVLAHRRPSNVE